MAKDFDSILAELEEYDLGYELPKGISKKKAAKKALKKAKEHADYTKQLEKESEAAEEKKVEGNSQKAFVNSGGKLDIFAESYSEEYVKETGRENGLPPMTSATDFIAYLFEVLKFDRTDYKDAKSEIGVLKHEIVTAWKGPITKLLKEAQDAYQKLFKVTSAEGGVSTDVLEMYVNKAKDVALGVDLNFWRLVVANKGKLDEAVAFFRISGVQQSAFRNDWIKNNATDEAITKKRFEKLKKMALADVLGGAGSSKLLTSKEISAQKEERKRQNSLLKKYKKLGVTKDNLESFEDELDIREELADLKRSKLSKYVGGKAADLKEKYLGDDSLVAKVMMRKFRQGRHDKRARMMALQAKLNTATRSREGDVSALPTDVTPFATPTKDQSRMAATADEIAGRKLQATLDKIAKNTGDIAKNGSDSDFGVGPLVAALGAISLPALSAALVGGLTTAVTAYLATKFGGESMPSETGNYKLAKPITEMGAWERFSSRAGSRRQDIEEMVENGKKFTAEQAADIKKYYDVEVPVDEKAAGQKTLSYSAPPTEANPTGASAAPPPASTTVNPKALAEAVSGSAGAAYSSAKAAVSNFVAPVGGRISSLFGPRNVKGGSKNHKGIDFAVPVGTPVAASGAGTVSLVDGNHKDYGQVVMVSHPDGTSSLYAHNSQLLVKKGDQVEAGQQIALSGNTGRSTGPHVHFEMLKGNHMGAGQFDPSNVIPSLAGATAAPGTATLAQAASMATPNSPEAPPASTQSPVPGAPITQGSVGAVAAALGTTPKPANGGTNVATVPTYAYMDAKFFALNLGAIT